MPALRTTVLLLIAQLVPPSSTTVPPSSTAVPPSSTAVHLLPSAVRWSVPISANPAAPPVIDGDKVFVVLESGAVQAHRITDGTTAWKVDLRSEFPVAADGERVFVAAGEAIHALNAADGLEAWLAPAGNITIPPVAHEGGRGGSGGSATTMDPAAAQAISGAPDAARELFELVDRRLAEAGTVPDTVAVTVYDKTGVALAWVGRPADAPNQDRLTGPSAFFVAPSALGLRLVHILPILGADHRRVGSVAVEHVLLPAPATATIPDSGYVLETPLGPASLRTRVVGAGDRPRDNTFLLHAPGGEPLLEVAMAPADLDNARRVWRQQVLASALTIAAMTCLLLIGPILDRRMSATTAVGFLRTTASALALLAIAAAIAAVAMFIGLGRWPPAGALLLGGGLTIATAVALVAGPVLRLRIALRARRRTMDGFLTSFLARQLLGGVVVAIVLVAFARLLPRVVDPATVDLRHFSLHPWNATRLALLTGILATHAAVLWTCTLILTAALSTWRMAAAVTYRKPAAHPKRSSGQSPQVNARIAGARPNETTSASESSSTPNAEEE